MRILLTNDDGVDSAGLFALKQALSRKHKVDIIAPDRNWSITGHSRIMDKPLRVREFSLRDGSTAFTTDGTPADCVALASLGFLPERPELVISGINHGSNMGDDITYSGTVAAAMEGIICGFPSIAVSMSPDPQWPVDVGAEFIERLVDQIVERGLSDDTLLNVNVPNVEHDLIKGVLITRLGKRTYKDELVTRVDPRGNTYYWIGGMHIEDRLDEGTDVAAIRSGYVSVTPIHLDLTDHNLIDKLKGWDLRF
jgi:5'-nucleotidase